MVPSRLWGPGSGQASLHDWTKPMKTAVLYKKQMCCLADGTSKPAKRDVGNPNAGLLVFSNPCQSWQAMKIT